MSISRSFIPEASNRFIPTTSSSLVYRNCEWTSPQEESKPIQPSFTPNVSLSLREDVLFNRTDSSSIIQRDHTSSFSSEYGSITSSSIYSTKSTPSIHENPLDLHQETVAEALDFQQGSKVLKFKQDDSKHRLKQKPNSVLDIAGPLFSFLNYKEIMKILINDTNKSGIKKHSKPGKTIIASDILQAPGLRNDYYSNLVSWSFKTNRVAVGLGSKVYLWGVDNHVIQVNYENEELVTAISCSKDDWILIATAGGRILLIDQAENTVVAEYAVRDNKCIFCITWFPDSKTFIAGDDYGEVYIFRATKFNARVLIELIKNFKCHQQHICGMLFLFDH